MKHYAVHFYAIYSLKYDFSYLDTYFHRNLCRKEQSIHLLIPNSDQDPVSYIFFQIKSLFLAQLSLASLYFCIKKEIRQISCCTSCVHASRLKKMSSGKLGRIITDLLKDSISPEKKKISSRELFTHTQDRRAVVVLAVMQYSREYELSKQKNLFTEQGGLKPGV